MKRIVQWLQKNVGSFFQVHKSIKAKIFVSFSCLTMVIATLISLYWSQFTIHSTTSALVDSMEKSLDSSLAQVENAVEDVRKMHTTLIYETTATDYLFDQDLRAPNKEWFEKYNQVYSSIRLMTVNLSRTVLGTGIFKANGETCTIGTTSLPQDTHLSQEIWERPNESVVFSLEKDRGERSSEVMRYLYVGRVIAENDQEQAVIITRMNDSVFERVFEQTTYPGGFILLLDSQGNLVYDSSPGELQEVKSALIAGEGEDAPYTTLSHTSAVSGFRGILAIPNQYISQINATTYLQTTVIILVMVLIVAVISSVVTNKITFSLKRLSENMRQFGTEILPGETVHFAKIDSSDEIGELNRAFLRMTDQIHWLMDDIRLREEQKRKMEIQVLRAQISPHFLYNSLNTINYLAVLQNVDNIRVLTMSLIDLLQGAVNVDDQLIPLDDELKYSKSYLNIQRYRFPQEIQVEYQISPETLRWKVPKMILQPIVENALIHGLADTQKEKRLRICAYSLDQKELICTVTDNGVGMSEERIQQVMSQKNNENKMRFSGIGIGNVDARIKMQFGKQYGISIFSQEGVFTTVEISLPVIEEKETGNNKGGQK